jgi:hypothetical protein
MLLIIASIVIVGLLYATKTAQKDGLIARTPYNNRYSDASGARDDYLG